ncbi:MAG: thioredoxin family protein [Flavobacteriales bacterium]|nr:thioredoxin family protein [Flavobacteriales bacterium]MCX7649988.1 thioredoxin family protein [Flavobacteriales bacterium]MDW8433146.1 thioredoxin family protein [Flavobacteriales bacterium]
MSVIISTDADFHGLLQQHPRVFVKYYADWCGTCRLMAPKFRRLSEDPRFEGIVFVDVNAEHNPEARKLAGVDNLPFFAAFREGRLLKGAATSREENLVEMLTELTA